MRVQEAVGRSEAWAQLRSFGAGCGLLAAQLLQGCSLAQTWPHASVPGAGHALFCLVANRQDLERELLWTAGEMLGWGLGSSWGKLSIDQQTGVQAVKLCPWLNVFERGKVQDKMTASSGEGLKEKVGIEGGMQR